MQRKGRHEETAYQFIAELNGSILIATLLAGATSTEHTNPVELWMRYLTTCLHLLVARKIVSYMLSLTVTQRFCNVCKTKRVSQNPNSVPNTIFPCFKLLQTSVRVSEAVTTITKLHSLRRKREFRRRLCDCFATTLRTLMPLYNKTMLLFARDRHTSWHARTSPSLFLQK